MRMGDNNPREIVGIGEVQIKMHDGMIHTLKDVRHVPKMARNLISLSTLAVEGYKYSGSGGVVKVAKGSLIHMIGDMNSAKLYSLRGSTINATAAAVTNDKSDNTNLWHMRLGHMSKLGMAELVKRELLLWNLWHMSFTSAGHLPCWAYELLINLAFTLLGI